MKRGGSCRRICKLESQDEGGTAGGIADWNWRRGRNCRRNCGCYREAKNKIKRVVRILIKHDERKIQINNFKKICIGVN